jgi:hypothetical protein
MVHVGKKDPPRRKSLFYGMEPLMQSFIFDYSGFVKKIIALSKHHLAATYKRVVVPVDEARSGCISFHWCLGYHWSFLNVLYRLLISLRSMDGRVFRVFCLKLNSVRILLAFLELSAGVGA